MSEVERRRDEAEIGVAVLAAGGSTRMGRQKLLMELGGETLVRRAARTALAAGLGPVVVVVGSDAQDMSRSLQGLPVRIVVNVEWASGQGTSVVVAARALGACDAIVLLAADQPLVESDDLVRLARAYRSSTQAVYASACCSLPAHAPGCSGAPVDLAADETAFAAPSCERGSAPRRGNPALFDRSVFCELEALVGDAGARQLFSRHEIADVEVSDPVLFLDADDVAAYTQVVHAWMLRGGLRASFPLLGGAEEVGNQPLAYLDSAATSQVPAAVLEAQEAFERTSRSNIHRGVYPLAEQASDAYEQARCEIASFFGVYADGLVFTHGATEALNLVAFGWGAHNLEAGDLVAVDTGGHHANIVPWQMLAARVGIELAFIPLDACGLVDEEGWRKLLARRPRAVALSASSNVTGLCNDVPRLVREAHAAGAVVAVDCAQSAGHLPLDFAALGADFAAVSAHKMYGPFGIGALLVAPGTEAALHPLLGGGGMIESVDERAFSCKKAPLCFEAGTPNITGAVGFAAACRFVSGIGLEAAASHGRALCDRAVGLLSAVDGVRIAGGNELGQRASIVSFALDDVHPHDVAQVLADRNVAVRAGNHCAMPLHRVLGVPATVRASFGVYSDACEVDRLVEGVKQAKEVFGRG